MATQPTFYWHDYETFGINPANDRPAQFAGVRTDMDLNILGDPLLIYCKPGNDYLPSPQACLITGITPTHADQHGVNEAEFIQQIHRQLSCHNTCTIGYNNIRFDDEFTRYTLYRNFFDPYAHEWKNGNSRWDLLDVVRLTRALRPQGIVWPETHEGKVSNKLEHLTAANGIAHTAAHDALSDVYATIAVAKLIRTHQPRLYDYLFSHRGKQQQAELLNLRERNMLVHSSGMFPNTTLNTSLIMPLAKHPDNANGIIVYDLRYDPEPLLDLDEEAIYSRVFTATADLPSGLERIPLKTVHINKCPVVTPYKVLDPASAERIAIDTQRCQQHRQRILDAIDNVRHKVVNVFSRQPFNTGHDPDQALYSGGFFSSEDRRRMDALRDKSSAQLARLKPLFDDPRIPEMLFRYRARNYPESLNNEERTQWESFRQERFYQCEQGTISMHQQFLNDLAQCRSEHPTRQSLFDELAQYAERIRPKG